LELAPDAIAEAGEQQALELKAKVWSFGSDVKDQIAGGRGRRMRRPRYRRKRPQLRRPLIETKTVPEIVTNASDA